jgi:uroporphyrinogen decarboxylase
MTKRERFLAACHCQPVDRPPIWLMRQAGRYLPEYRALKEQHGFLTMVKTPELATEVTLQPLRRFGFDAAILFSDILVIPEAMGQPYEFRPTGGIAMAFAIESGKQIEQLVPDRVRERLGYVGGALRLLKQELRGETALIGFCGSPWTLATYMIEGGSAVQFQKVKQFFFNEPVLFNTLLEKLTQAVCDYVEMQIEAGADAVQIFDSWGGICSGHTYEAASLQWIRRIVERVNGRIPVILFAKGLHARMADLASTGVQAVSVDWTADLKTLREITPANVALQGNFDPVLLNMTPDIVRREARLLLQQMEGRPGHIFNLGHGISPEARIENVEALVQTVQAAQSGK